MSLRQPIFSVSEMLGIIRIVIQIFLRSTTIDDLMRNKYKISKSVTFYIDLVL